MDNRIATLKKAALNTSRILAHRGGRMSQLLYKAADVYRKTYNNLNYDMKTNGEFYVLDRIASTAPITVFDVGANKGDYTMACLSRFSSATVHSFEIAPQTFRKLAHNVSSPRVVLNEFGLSNAAGSTVLRYNPDDDGSSSMVEGDKIHDGRWEEITVRVTTGDCYCEQNAVDQIDLVKVDVEGAEHLVFEGFSGTFKKGNISAVQFEFGMVNIYSKFLLKDFWDFFSSHGFLLGPIMPTGVVFKSYNTRDEDFQGPPNFFAVHKSKPAVIEAVRRR
ncbi:methyltransferase FkbM family [Rhizobium sp. CF080]|uniref:FkbM family methyltransferase n=1 Tax=Rhizobium sp. (strain CF080) TaxID=1144310 RepID=UPI0002715E55|nr:FkbM family methyltransferase [Rhizobium sp. CF080]EUB99536.1 methyltransferase FkbM family [Rhizobium sp. CF080]